MTLVCVSSCTTLHQKAQKYFEAGAYELALGIYDQILGEDPNDTDAQIGRLKSRDKLIDTKLIEVRHSRIAGNEQNSVNMLLSLVELENEWKFFPRGPVAFTQEEESAEAIKFVTKQVNVSLKKKLPLQGMILASKYKIIFQGDLLAKHETLLRQIRDDGERDCRRLSAKGETLLPYYSRFVHKYCSYWGAQARDLANLEDRKLSELFSALRVDVSVENLLPELKPIFVDASKRAFERTAWFDARAKKELPIKIRGKFLREVKSRPASRVHEYTVKVPYTVYLPVMKTRQVPYTDYDYQCVYNAYIGQTCANVPVTRYRTDYYTENEPTTLYRDEPRSQPYDGIEVFQFIAIFLKGDLNLKTAEKEVQLSEKTDEKDFQHDWNLPEIGLYPAKPKLTDPLEWVKRRAAEFGEKTASHANEVWKHYYCRPSPAHASLEQQGEQVHRCLRLRDPALPQFVTDWYENNFGIDLREAHATIGLLDY